MAEDLKTGVIYGMILGFFDSTIGLKISMLLGANTGDHMDEITTAFWIFIVVYMIGFGALVGLIGGGLATKVKKGAQTPNNRYTSFSFLCLFLFCKATPY